MLGSDDERIFPGYRRIGLDGKFGRSRPDLYASIEHFYQSERFRGVDEVLRLAVMKASTPREARKLAGRHADRQRPDWAERNVRAMACGVLMKMREHPDFAKAVLTRPRNEPVPYPFHDHFWGVGRPGVSQGMYTRLLNTIQRRVQEGTMRLLATGSPTFHNRFLFQAKLDALLRKAMPDLVIIPGKKGCDELAERWAMERLIPVRHCPVRGRKRSAERQRYNDWLVATSTHAIVFHQGDAATEDLVQSALRGAARLRIVRADQKGRVSK